MDTRYRPDTDTYVVTVWQLLARSPQWHSKHIPQGPQESQQWTLKDTQNECEIISLCQQNQENPEKLNTDQVRANRR